MTIAEFKNEIRMHDLGGDPWGVAMGAWFDCAAHLYEVGDCPVEWKYQPGSLGNHVDIEGPFYDQFSESTPEELAEIEPVFFSNGDRWKVRNRSKQEIIYVKTLGGLDRKVSLTAGYTGFKFRAVTIGRVGRLVNSFGVIK